jgi:hypothetical protein
VQLPEPGRWLTSDPRATMRVMEVRDVPYKCDVCVGPPPAWRYDIPPGTPVGLTASGIGAVDGQPVTMMSVGGFAMCDTCHAIMETGTPMRAKRFAQRMVHGSPDLMKFPAGARGRMMRACIEWFERIIPLLKNPRPDPGKGTAPLDGQMMIGARLSDIHNG